MNTNIRAILIRADHELLVEQPRSVILAVISAKNDLENQIVMKMRREVDPAGQRTMGGFIPSLR